MSRHSTREKLTRCVIRCLWLTCWVATTAAAQEAPVLRAESVAFRPAVKSNRESNPQSALPPTVWVSKPANLRFALNSGTALGTRAAIPARPSAPSVALRPDEAALAPLRVTAEHTSFLSESRIPIAEMWSGRLGFTAVQQRFHAANLYSVLSPEYAAAVAMGPGTESIVARSRVNYGLGLQLRFGR